MKKSVTMLALAATLFSVADASENTVVLKDTRQFEEYNSPIEGKEGCTTLGQRDSQTHGDCAVKTLRYVKAGVLLRRNLNSGVCMQSTWKSRRPPIQNWPPSSVYESREVFGCELDGTRKVATYQATDSDKDMQALLTRWASIDGKKLVWEVRGNASLLDAESFNMHASLYTVSSFDEALLKLNKSLEEAFFENAAKMPPLQACIYTNAIVVRTQGQPHCSKPL